MSWIETSHHMFDDEKILFIDILNEIRDEESIEIYFASEAHITLDGEDALNMMKLVRTSRGARTLSEKVAADRRKPGGY